MSDRAERRRRVKEAGKAAMTQRKSDEQIDEERQKAMNALMSILAGFERVFVEIHQWTAAGKAHPDATYTKVKDAIVLADQSGRTREAIAVGQILVPHDIYEGLVMTYRAVMRGAGEAALQHEVVNELEKEGGGS